MINFISNYIYKNAMLIFSFVIIMPWLWKKMDSIFPILKILSGDYILGI